MIIVTGATGFIGSVFCSKLLNNNYDIIRYDLPDYDILKINELQPKHPIEFVVHFAAIADLNVSIANQDKNFDVNIRGTYEVAKFCAKNHIPLIFISTACIYGNSGDEIEFEDSTIPSTIEPYACSKMAGEYILRGMPGLNYVILRIGTVYGTGMRKELFNYIAFDKNIKGESIQINGDGRQTRNYIYINDLIDGIYSTMIKFDKCRRQVINLCGDEQISVLETLRVVQEITGKPYKEINILCENRYGEIQDEKISIEKAEKLLDWKPIEKYYSGMYKTYNWIKYEIN
jgi:nucleoside-diphosphate-sugar epimerase